MIPAESQNRVCHSPPPPVVVKLSGVSCHSSTVVTAGVSEAVNKLSRAGKEGKSGTFQPRLKYKCEFSVSGRKKWVVENSPGKTPAGLQPSQNCWQFMRTITCLRHRNMSLTFFFLNLPSSFSKTDPAAFMSKSVGDLLKI